MAKLDDVTRALRQHPRDWIATSKAWPPYEIVCELAAG